MRSSSQILIFVDVQKALDAGIKFYLSDNGVVLTAGNDKGFLTPEFFSRVETAADRKPLSGWHGPEGVPATSASVEPLATLPTDDPVETSSSSIAGSATEEGGGAQTAIAADMNGEIEDLEKKVEATTL